jgi:hypothetical protein
MKVEISGPHLGPEVLLLEVVLVSREHMRGVRGRRDGSLSVTSRFTNDLLP